MKERANLILLKNILHLHLSLLDCHCVYNFPVSPACEFTGSPGRREHFAHTIHSFHFPCALEPHVHAVVVLPSCTAQQNQAIMMLLCECRYEEQTLASTNVAGFMGAKPDPQAMKTSPLGK